VSFFKFISPTLRPFLGPFLGLALAGCSGSGSGGYDYGKMRSLALANAQSADILPGYEKYVLIPEDIAGDVHRLIIYPDGVASSYNTAVFQLSDEDIKGVAGDMLALRHGAGDYIGDKFVGVWRDGRLINLYPVEMQDKFPISVPEVGREAVPELALLAMTKDHPMPDFDVPKDTRDLQDSLSAYQDIVPEEETENAVPAALDELTRIYETTPLMSAHERRSSFKPGKNLMVLVWDDGYANPEFKNLDKDYSQILVASNLGPTSELIPLPNTNELRLHPKQTNGADPVVRQTQITLAGVIVPPNTSAVLVRAE